MLRKQKHSPSLYGFWVPHLFAETLSAAATKSSSLLDIAERHSDISTRLLALQAVKHLLRGSDSYLQIAEYRSESHY